MAKRKVGVMIESFRLGIREGIRKAAEIGADGFQIYVTSGDMHPSRMSGTARGDFVHFVENQGLVISALCGDFGHGFLDAAKNDELVARSKACVDLAVDLGTDVVTTHIGQLPEDKKDARWGACHQAISELSVYGEAKGVYFATETGPESADHLLSFLESVPGTGIKVNYDPANLVMGGFDALGGVKVLKDYIVHTHAKDAVYVLGKQEEVPLGEGDVNFPLYLSALDEIGYDGFLTIEREVGADPVRDIVKAVEFLRGF
ncbi:MAG: sugar phosphate isomerase/epimerase family protein [Candidatus Latescibacterota bacterium]